MVAYLIFQLTFIKYLLKAIFESFFVKHNMEQLNNIWFAFLKQGCKAKLRLPKTLIFKNA